MGADLKRQLRELIAQYGGTRDSYPYKVHHNVLPRLVDVLYQSGYKLAHAENLDHRHIAAIFRVIGEQGLPQQTMHLVWTELGHWARWVGKASMLQPLETYWQKYHVPCDEAIHHSLVLTGGPHPVTGGQTQSVTFSR
jgi:hypothetical protein